MCVISLVTEERPTEAMVASMYEANPAGAGIAWRTDHHVEWEKGCDMERIQELCATVPLPYVAHFRIPTVGGKIESLCHPFPIDQKVSLALKGKTRGYVLFHNGHWGTWKDTLLKAAIQLSVKLPQGKWSDSRGMAWMASHYGLGILEVIDEKAIAFGPKDTEIEVAATGWNKVEGGVWVSNKHWEYRTHNTNWTRVGGDHTRGDMNVMGNRMSQYDSTKLPEIYHKPSEEEEKKGKIIDVGIVDDAIDDGGEGPIEPGGARVGGSHTPIPFVRACQLWAKGELSKKQWKRALKAHDTFLWREREKRMKESNRKVIQRSTVLDRVESAMLNSELTTPPPLIH